MKNGALLLLSLLAIFLISCRQESQLKIVVRNLVTKEPYTGLSFVIRENTDNVFAPLIDTDSKTIFSGEINENGEAIIDLKLKKDDRKYYGLWMDVPINNFYMTSRFDHQVPSEGIYEAIVNKESHQEHIIEFYPGGELIIAANNVNCEGPDDNFKLYRTGSTLMNFGYYRVFHPLNGLVLEGNGCYSYEGGVGGAYGVAAPAGEMSFKWEVTRSSGTTVFYDTIFINPGEQILYQIDY